MSLEEAGYTLKERRISLGLTLTEVQYSTKIRGRYLEALEESNPSVLPPGPYARGIIRRYCEELHLDPRPVLEAYGEWLRDQEDQSLTKKLRETPGSRGITLRATGGSRTGWVFGLLLLIVLMIVGGIYYYVVFPDLPWTAPDPPQQEGTPTDEGEDGEPEESETAENEEPEPEQPPGEEANREEAKPEASMRRTEEGATIRYEISGVTELKVTLSTAQNCWIRVTVDDGSPRDMTLEAGASQSWSAAREISIRAGNPAELEILVNDTDEDTVRADSPRDLVFLLESPPS
ncbi:MAG: helix-turn-helix domain-containing protein [Bacillota bacterium]